MLKGLPIYELSTGSKIGEVCDLSISDQGTVNGLLIKNGAFIKKTRFIHISNVHSFGHDGVMVESMSKLEPIQENVDYTFQHHRHLLGKEMLTTEGERLGLLEDVYFLEEMGTIIGYELTDGFFSDIMEGKRVVKTVNPPSIGKDAIIVNVDKE